MTNGARFILWHTGLTVFLTMQAVVAADVPRLIHYQGKLRDASGATVTATVNLRFRLYDGATISTPSFDETQGAVAVTNGLFSVLIGGATVGGVSDSALGAPVVYLGISVNGGAELSPRTHVASTPYTVKAKSAEQLVKPDTLDQALSVDPAGNIGIGTASPGARLDVAGSVKIADGSEGTNKVLTSDANGLASWQTAGGGVPAGAIMFFNSAACPVGWSEVTAARGRYIVGLPAGGTLNSPVGSALADLEDRPTGRHRHDSSIYLTSNSGLGGHVKAGDGAKSANVDNSLGGSPFLSETAQSTDDVPLGTNAPYIQCLVCQKD